MKFFLDKNIPKSIIIILQKEGHMAEHARITFPQDTVDSKIAEYAKTNNAILITRDLEFGSSLVYPKNSHYGLIIIRLPYYFVADQISENFEQFLKSIDPEELKGYITVVELNRHRKRKL